MKRCVMTESLRIQKLGKSLGVILPKRLIEQLDVGKGDFLYPSFTGTCVLLSPDQTFQKRSMTLTTICSAMRLP